MAFAARKLPVPQISRHRLFFPRWTITLSLSVWQPQEPEWKNVCGKKVSLLFDSAGFSPSTIESQRSRVLAGKRLSIDIESEDERHCRSVGLSLLIQISRTPLDINHSLPLCTPYGNPYVHTQEPWTTTPERLFRFKSRQKEYGFPLLLYETQFHGSATITARRVFRADRFLQGQLGFCSSFVLCLLCSVCVIGRPRIFVYLQWRKNTHNMERYVKYRKYNILVIIFNGRNESLSWIIFWKLCSQKYEYNSCSSLVIVFVIKLCSVGYWVVA